VSARGEIPVLARTSDTRNLDSARPPATARLHLAQESRRVGLSKAITRESQTRTLFGYGGAKRRLNFPPPKKNTGVPAGKRQAVIPFISNACLSNRPPRVFRGA
jgi:hypothetical protein